jgi:hypothetical protein
MIPPTVVLSSLLKATLLCISASSFILLIASTSLADRFKAAPDDKSKDAQKDAFDDNTR